MADNAGHIGTRSVLFTDLVESTELRVRLGEAAADELRRVHDHLLTDVMQSHQGIVVKSLGDGIMATFESAADATAGAVAAQQAVEAHARRFPDRAFAIRVGISIGDVSAEEGDVFGVPVVEASRLCAVSAPGEILVADLVRALARGRASVVFEPMGDLALKGLQEPVPACRVMWEPLVEPPLRADGTPVPIPPALVGAATAYVGREEMLARLADEWAAARGGGCRTVLLAGEPGVGKTRTAAELGRLAFGDGGLVLFGRCDEELDVPYQPFVEALDHYVRHAAAPLFGRLPGELTRLVPDLGGHAGALPPPVRSDPASEEYRLFEATASWLMDAARSAGGLLLVLDDLHWATKPTLHLMQHVVRTASDEGAPLLVLVTYRDTDVDRTHPLAATLGDLRRLPGVERLPVANLTHDEVLTFIETAAGHELDGPIRGLADAVFDETEGNPFFVGEVLRHLIETGGVRREGNRWVVGEPDRVLVPEGVRDVVGRRLNRLPETANEVLSVAAVLGRDFAVESLLAVTTVSEDDALDALDLAVRARLIEETGGDQYRFAHALVRTTLYDELSATRRRRLHRRVADVLEKLRPDDVRALAYHCTEAGPDGGDNSRALHYTFAAAEQSLAARAFADAEAGFRSVLELLDDQAEQASPDRVAAMCGLGEAQRDQGDPRFRQTLLDAAAQAVAIGHPPLLQRAVLANNRGYTSVIGDVDRERVAFIETALEQVGPESGSMHARLLGRLASELTFCGEHERRVRLAGEAVAMAREVGDPELLGDVLTATRYASMTAMAWREFLESCEEAVRQVDEIGDPTLRAVARFYYSGALLTAGQIEDAYSCVVEMDEIAAAECAPTVQWAARSNLVRVPAMAGRLDEAEALNNACLEFGQRLGQPDAEQWWAAATVSLAWLRGYAGYLADASAEFADRYPLHRSWRSAQAWLLAEAGRVDESRAILTAHELDPSDLLDEPLPFCASSQLAFTAWLLADRELATSAIEALGPYRPCWSHYYMSVIGPVSWPLGLAQAAVGGYDQAIDLLDEALSTLDSHHFRALATLVAVDLAEVLVRRGTAADRARAADLLTGARQTATETGATGVVERIDRLAG